ncbi:MAG: M15 family metallopeptidase [Candidatus Saccharibacteria bacterium]
MQIRKPKKINKITKVLVIVFVFLFVASASYITCSYLVEKQAQQALVQKEISRKIAEKLALEAIEAKKKEPVYVTLPGAATIRADVSDYSITGNFWMLVNKTRPISTDFAPDAVKIPDVTTIPTRSVNEQSVRSDIEAPLIALFQAATAANHYLLVGSGYRPADVQLSIFNNMANQIGRQAANQYVALPGQSEHQTGLALDIGSTSMKCFLNSCFADTADGIWLAENAHKYGFTLRYPLGKEAITGYGFEPWHFRYVGVDLATALYESKLTLDEAWPYLEAACTTLKQNGAI